MRESEYVKFRTENNVSYLIFWATIFLTCCIGIIELIFEIRNSLNSGINSYFISLFIIYGVLLIGIIFSIRGCFRIYCENVYFWRNEYFGVWYKIFPVINKTDLDKFLLNDKDEPRYYIRDILVIASIGIFMLPLIILLKPYINNLISSIFCG